jgi:predicted nucleic acid-binding protein
MPEMLSNTSCLIALANIQHLDILRLLYEQVHTTEEVQHEFGLTLPSWIKSHKVRDRDKLMILQNLVDLGEASIIALAYQFDDVTLILDDHKARKLANNLGFRHTGLLGILIKAKQVGIISSVNSILEELKAVGFRFSLKLETKILQLAGEN